jgi:cell division protein YceG involved in septum cleavage
MTLRKKTFLLIAVIALAFCTSVFYSAPGSPDETMFSIGQGESVESITDRLKEAGFVRSGLLFR